MRKKWLRLLVVAWATLSAAQAQTYVTPMLGGGQTPADMAHIDIFYDDVVNQFHATIDESVGKPILRALPAGTAFDPAKPYAVLGGKAYNAQYGWNAGGQFAIPPGAAIWIELLNCSPGLEVYAGSGQLAAYTPIFGTAGSSRRWRWSGVMAHNTYALASAAIPFQFASYHVYFGDATTGAREAYAAYADTTVTLTWDANLPVSPVMLFGAVEETNAAPLSFLNSSEFEAASGVVQNLNQITNGPLNSFYACPFSAIAVPATSLNGGPYTNHAAPGSRLELELVSLTGPQEGGLTFWEPGETQPSFTLSTGQNALTNRICLSEDGAWKDIDPYGAIQGRQFVVNAPGLYELAFRAIDTCTKGVGAAPIHTPSPVYRVYFQAGLTISQLIRQAGAATLLFAGQPGRTFSLERSARLGATAEWQVVAGPIAGTNTLQTLTDLSAPTGAAFYRILEK